MSHKAYELYKANTAVISTHNARARVGVQSAMEVKGNQMATNRSKLTATTNQADTCNDTRMRNITNLHPTADTCKYISAV